MPVIYDFNPPPTDPRQRLARELHSRACRAANWKGYAKALRQFTEALAAGPDFHLTLRILDQRAHSYCGVGQWAQAQADWESLLRLDPDHSWAWHGFGRMRACVGAWDEAEEAYTRAMSGPYGMAYIDRAVARRALGNQVGAETDCRQALDSGAFGTEDQAWAHFQLGLLALDKGDRATALAACEVALALSPEYDYRRPQYLVRCGWLYLGQVRWPAARDAYAEACQLDGHCADARRSLDWLMQQERILAEWDTELTVLLTDKPHDVVVRIMHMRVALLRGCHSELLTDLDNLEADLHHDNALSAPAAAGMSRLQAIDQGWRNMMNPNSWPEPNPPLYDRVGLERPRDLEDTIPSGPSGSGDKE